MNGENVEKFLDEVAKSTGHTLESMLLQNSALQAFVDRCLEEENVKIGLEDVSHHRSIFWTNKKSVTKSSFFVLSSFKFTGLLPIEDKFLQLFRKTNQLQSTVDFIRVKFFFSFLFTR